jgi:hypothetical protein
MIKSTKNFFFLKKKERKTEKIGGVRPPPRAKPPSFFYFFFCSLALERDRTTPTGHGGGLATLKQAKGVAGHLHFAQRGASSSSSFFLSFKVLLFSIFNF